MNNFIGTIKHVNRGGYSIEEYCKLILEKKNITSLEPYDTFTNKFLGDSEEIFGKGVKFINSGLDLFQICEVNDVTDNPFFTVLPSTEPGYFHFFMNTTIPHCVDLIIQEGVKDMYKQAKDILETEVMKKWGEKYTNLNEITCGEVYKKINEELNKETDYTE